MTTDLRISQDPVKGVVLELAINDATMEDLLSEKDVARLSLELLVFARNWIAQNATKNPARKSLMKSS